MTSPDDRLHALDQVEPADAWADITRRADGPVDIPLTATTASSTFRRPALIAAAVLVVATIAGVAALAARSDDGGRPVASNGGATTTQSGVVPPAASGDAAAFWGRRWTVLELFDENAALPVASGRDGTTMFDTGTERDGVVMFSGCNGAGARVALDGDRLVQQEALASTKIGCSPELEAQDHWFATLLGLGPTVTIHGNRLTLATPAGVRVELVDNAGATSRSATTSVPAMTATTPADAGNTSSPTFPSGDTSAGPPDPGRSSSGGPVGSPSTTFPAIDQPADGKFFNHLWQVTAISDGGSNPGFDGAVVDASGDSKVTVAGCNGAGGAMRLDGDRLRVDGPWNHTAMGCVSTNGTTDRSMEQDAWFDSFLRAEPTVAVSGRAATLTTSTATVRLRLP